MEPVVLSTGAKVTFHPKYTREADRAYSLAGKPELTRDANNDLSLEAALVLMIANVDGQPASVAWLTGLLFEDYYKLVDKYLEIRKASSAAVAAGKKNS